MNYGFHELLQSQVDFVGFRCFWLARTIDASVDEKMSDSRFNSPSLRTKKAHVQNQVNGKNVSSVKFQQI